MPEEKDFLKKVKERQNALECLGYFYQGILEDKSELTKLALTTSITGHAFFVGRGYVPITKERFEKEARNNPDLPCDYFREETPFLKSFLEGIYSNI
ncbi:MAG: hypothetical protein PVJ67_06135 [Candidatus Pacearchaeota archaeon]|jgi:hypothetical protein